MRTVPRKVLATTGAAAMLLAGLAGCGSNNNSGTPAAAKNTKVDVHLVSSTSSDEETLRRTP